MSTAPESPRRASFAFLLAASRALLALLASSACGPSSTAGGPQADIVPVPNTPASIDLEIGSGAVDYVALADGDAVDLIHGSQGGYHIWTAIRVRDLTVQEGAVNVSSRFEDGSGPAGLPSGWAARLVVTDGAGIQAGMRNGIDDPGAVNGKRIILRAELVARDGRHGAAERVVVPHAK
jgi:hypothetical protein